MSEREYTWKDMLFAGFISGALVGALFFFVLRAEEGPVNEALEVQKAKSPPGIESGSHIFAGNWKVATVFAKSPYRLTELLAEKGVTRWELISITYIPSGVGHLAYYWERTEE